MIQRTLGANSTTNASLHYAGRKRIAREGPPGTPPAPSNRKTSMRQLIATLGILAALAVGLYFFLSGPAGDGRRESPDSTWKAPQTAGDTGRATPVELEALDDAPSAKSGSTERLAPIDVESSRPERRIARPMGPAHEGRIELPPTSPTDPTLRVLFFAEERTPREIYGEDGFVVELGRGKKGEVLTVAEVAADGTFSFQIDEELDLVWAAIDGRFLFSLAPQRCDTRSGEPLVLEARLGAAIRGRVKVPGDDAEPYAGMRVDLLPDQDQFALMSADAHWLFGRAVDVDENGRFELRGLDPVRPYEAEVETELFANEHWDDLELFPGKILDLETTLLQGGRLFGRVIDEDEKPMAGAGVEAVKTVMFGFPGGALARSVADDEGRFELRGVPPGKVTVLAKVEGRLESRPFAVEIRDGQTKEGLELRVERGAMIRGVVEWADGSPAPEARVDVRFDPGAMMGTAAMNMARGASGKAKTDAEGRFTVRGLGKGPFLVEARAPTPGGPAGSHEHFVERSGVQPDSELVLVLAPPTSVAGHVVDLEGEPVCEFEIRASSEGAAFFMPGRSEKQSFTDEAGRFSFIGLPPGNWQLEARAKGYGPSPPAELVLPLAEDAEELTITLAAAAGVAGRVLDPSGGPLAGARVTVQTDRDRMIARIAGQLDLPETYSDGEGGYTLDGLSGGEVALVATHGEYAPSEIVTVELRAGALLDDVLLQLRTGAKLTGEVYDKEGKPASDARIILQDPNNWDTRMLKTDARGTFLVENLRPGSWNVTALVGQIDSVDASVDASDPAAAAEATSAFMDNMRFTMVNLDDGDEEHVVLGAPPEDPVKVSGKVTHAGDGAGGAMISFFPDGAEGFSAMKFTVVKSNGSYEVALDKPGRYHVQVQLNTSGGSMSQENVEYSEEIPKREEHRLDIELPTGRITGRVTGPDGNPSANTRMTLTTSGGMAMGTFMGGQYAEITTDSNGVYTFDFLRPGTYDLAAGGAMFGGAFGTASPQGRVIRSALKLSEGDLLDGIDFRLKEAGDITGKVTDPNGRPIQSAAIFVRDSEGRLLERFSMITSDHDGSFRYRGVQPGDYQLSARKDALTSPDSEWVSVREGSPSSVNIILVPGTMLSVLVSDTKTESVPDARVSIVDRDGREMHGMISFQEIMETVGGFTSDSYRFGPLSPGKYTVRAVAPDGREARRVVRIATGEGRRKVRLRLR